MCKIILIETSTSLCSTALAVDGKIVCSRVSSEPKVQASMTVPFIKEMIEQEGIKISDCDAVCVSSGPGSYTGLRVGVSTAKGLCFAADLPLIAIDSLELLTYQAKESSFEVFQHADQGKVEVPKDFLYIVPMIDARRMEVYTAEFSYLSASRLGEIRPEIITEQSFSKELSEGKVLFIGDGAGKCADIIHSDNAYFAQVYPLAQYLLTPAMREFKAGNFCDIAYFEPFYLKQFSATVSKKSLF